MHHKIFCVREFIKNELATAVQLAFRLPFNIQPSTSVNSICRCNHQFEQIGCLCKGKSSGRSRVSEENMRRIHESFELAENLEYHNQLSGMCWGAIYHSIESTFLNHTATKLWSFTAGKKTPSNIWTVIWHPYFNRQIAKQPTTFIPCISMSCFGQRVNKVQGKESGKWYHQK